MTDRVKKIMMGLAALAALGVGASAVAGAASGGKDTAKEERSEASEGAEGKDDATEKSEKGEEDEGSDKPVTGDEASRAKAAAEAETGGKAGAVERDNETGATYEVEVTKAGGQKVDVRVDDQFKVVGVDQDQEGENESGEKESAGK